ncbi:MAG: SDR family NAD(P)-dependent oxidoreductase [Parvibaculaceae bacterium]
MFNDLKTKRIVVTGGVTGIGGAASRALAKAGAKVFAQYLGGETEAADLARHGIATFRLDLLERKAPGRLIAEAGQRLGGIDVLINNAGGMVERRLIAEFDDALYERVLDLNVRQLVDCCRAVIPLFQEQRSGNIINVSSIAARSGGSAGSGIYAGTKGFVSAVTKSMAKELAPSKIRVNAVSPGTIHTAFHDRHSTPDKLEATRRQIPLGRLGTAEDCAGTFVYLASDEASGYVTGQVIEVNGGLFMG